MRPKYIARQRWEEQPPTTFEDDVVAATVTKTVRDWDWDYFRDRYLEGFYSWSQLVSIHDWWHQYIMTGVEYFHKRWINHFFREVDLKNYRVDEFGCGEGLLATYCLKIKKWSISKWRGYDIGTFCLDKGHRNGSRYIPCALSTQLWKADVVKGDVFISAHTIEHISLEQFKEFLDFLDHKWVFIEAPLSSKGKIWRGGGSPHVLTAGTDYVNKALKVRGYDLVFEERAGMDWCGCWRAVSNGS